MDQHDRDNLHFLLTADESTMQDWYSRVSQDDIDYALELLQMAGAELAVKEMELAEADEIMDLSQAQAVLSRFTSQ
jgi:hypothetical protein